MIRSAEKSSCNRICSERKSKEEAAETRRRIVTAAAGEFREHGIVATGLADLMQAAGLTHESKGPENGPKNQITRG